MQPGRARTSGLGVPPLLLARWVGWVDPVRPTHGVLVLSCPSAALRVHVCAVSPATWLLFTVVPARCVVLRVQYRGPLGSCSPVCPLGVWCCVCGVLGHLAPVHRCTRSVPCVACAVSWATSVLFTGAPPPCVALLVRCPGSLSSCSPVCPLGALLCVCGVLGHLVAVHQCARVVCCVASVVSWVTWLLFTGAPAGCVALQVRCPVSLGSCCPVCPLGVLCCVCGILGHLAPVYRCACWVCGVACAVSWATWLLFTSVPARCVALRVRCPGPLCCCSPVCPRGLLCCVCGVLGDLAPVHRCARWVRCFAGAVSCATWLLLPGVPPGCVVLPVRCPGPLGSCLPVCLLGVLCCVCGVLGQLAPVHRCARSCVALRVRCPGPLCSCSPLCPRGLLCCICGVLGHLAPVHRCACSVRCFACAVSWATWLPFTCVPARCVVLRVRCPGPLGSCSPVCALRPLLCLCGVLRHLAPVHPVPARCVVLRVRCPGPLAFCPPVRPLRVLCCVCRNPGQLGSCSPVCPLCVLCCACGVPGPWLLFSGVLARCAVFGVPCPGPLGSRLPVSMLGVLFCRLRVRGVAAGRTLVHPDGGCL